MTLATTGKTQAPRRGGFVKDVAGADVSPGNRMTQKPSTNRRSPQEVYGSRLKAIKSQETAGMKDKGASSTHAFTSIAMMFAITSTSPKQVQLQQQLRAPTKDGAHVILARLEHPPPSASPLTITLDEHAWQEHILPQS